VENPEQVEPVLVKTNLDGSFTYHSIGIARADSGIASLADMEGKVFGFGDPNSTSGYLIPLVEIPAPATRWSRASSSRRGLHRRARADDPRPVANGRLWTPGA
jgi:ABC-type phosphate/phosphonate transport system substrate-binding protein